MRRRALCIVLAITAAAAGTLTTVPAYAENIYEDVVFSTLDTSVPGHVTGTVTTNAPFVYLDLHEGTDDNYVFDTNLIEGPGTSTFDLETWSLGDSQIRAYACDTPDDPEACDDPTRSVVFTPNTVDPEITWPEDVTIGPSSAPYTVTVSDPGGGAHLIAVWNGGVMQELAHSGETTLDPGLSREGEGDIKIFRCYFPKSPFPCQPTGVSRHVTVRHAFLVMTPTISATPVAPDATSAPDTTVGVSVPSAPTNLLAHVTMTALNTPAAGPAFVRDVPVQVVNGQVSIPTDLTGVPDGRYWIRTDLSYDDPDFGRITGDSQGVAVVVDAAAPDISSVAFSDAAIYPAVDQYKDYVDLDIKINSDALRTTSRTYEIRGPGGIIAQSGTFGDPSYPNATIRFNARPDLPEGAYVATVAATDGLGRTTTRTSAPVVLSHKKLTWLNATQTVSAKASLVGKTVGRCSAIKSPSSHKWSGSLGLLGGSKCRTKGAAGTVTTLHRLHLPAAHAYGYVRVMMTGAAAKAKPRSTATFGWQLPNGAWWSPFLKASSSNGVHRGPSVQNNTVRTAGGDLVWAVTVKGGNQYDVRNFTITYDYRALR